MSRERCRSLDRTQGKHQESCLHPAGVYIPARCPSRLGVRASSSTEPKNIPSLPNLSDRKFGGTNGVECPDYGDSFGFLEDIEEPQFHELPADSSFDELRCILATPPRAAPAHQPAPTAAEKLEELRREITARVSPSGAVPQVQVKDVRQRVAAVAADKPKEPSLCPYKIPPLPENPREIPPPPKNPKDVVAFIRRAQAIARLKALEEKEAAANQPIGLPKKDVKGLRAPRALAMPASKSKPTVSKVARTTARPLPAVKVPPQKPTVPTKKIPLAKPSVPVKKAPPSKPCVVKKKTQPKTQHPPDFVPEDWAAAILKARNIAGLKTTNPKLIAKSAHPPAPSKAKPAPQVVPSEGKRKSPPRQASPQRPPKLATYESIMERVSEIRARASMAQALIEKSRDLLESKSQDEADELDEFEALEELYGADTASECIPVNQGAEDLQRRINILQQQLLHSPIQAGPMDEELCEFEALERELGIPPSSEVFDVESAAEDLHDRINLLKETLFQSPQGKTSPQVGQSPRRVQSPSRGQSPVFELPTALRYGDLLENKEAMAAKAAQIMQMESTQPLTPAARTTPVRSRSPIMAQTFDDAILQNIEMPDFDIHDVPEFAFSTEGLEDAGFGNFSIGDISMPDFDDEVSFEELGLQDVSSPSLCDLSISDEDLALEPDYPLETSTVCLTEESPQQTGVLSSIVTTLVDRFRNVFSSPKSPVIPSPERLSTVNLDTSLPTVFEVTPPPRPRTPTAPAEAAREAIQKPLSPKGPIVIPPHPKDPKDYKAMVKRAQAIQRKMAECAVVEAVETISKEKKGKKIVKSSIPKAAPPPKKKEAAQKKMKAEKPQKVYPPGEYSPSYAAAVARARSLAGLKNVSAVLNPERAKKIAERKAASEAKRAAIEALPPVERMRAKMRSMRRKQGGLPRPSIEILAALEAIRESLPKTEIKRKKRKWRPAGRLRVDRRVKPAERLFWRDFGRILTPTKRTQKGKGWKELSVMSPILEDQEEVRDLMGFSPLKPHEGRLRLLHLKEEALRKVAESQRTLDAQEIAEELSDIDTQILPPRFSPIRLQSPSSPRSEETKLENTIQIMGLHGYPETFREEVESSFIEDGEAKIFSRQFTTKTDEFGNVCYNIQQGTEVSGEEPVFEELAQEEPPDFLEPSELPPPRDPSIPTPSEIIDRIRMLVQQQLSQEAQQSAVCAPASPEIIDFPQDLPEEELFDVEVPTFDRTPPMISPQIQRFSPYEKDQRMYAWGEQPIATPPPREPSPKIPSPKISLSPPKVKSPVLKEKTPEAVICIPPPPKDPKDYKAMVKRAQAIENLRKQREAETATSIVQKPISKPPGRVPISKWIQPPQKDLKKPPKKKLVLKKQVPKIVPKKVEQQTDDDMECPTEPPPLPQKYIQAVARARLLRGLKNKSALLNPELAAQKAAEKAAYEALPEIEKIKTRVAKLQEMPLEKRQIKPSADLIGTLAAIRERVQAESAIAQSSVCQVAQVPVSEVLSPRRQQTPVQAPCVVVRPPSAELSADTSLAQFEALEAQLQAQELSHDTSLAQFEALEAELQQEQELFCDRSLQEFEALEAQLQEEQALSFDKSLDEFEALEAELQREHELSVHQSLQEFEALETELQQAQELCLDKSLDHFEALEAKIQHGIREVQGQQFYGTPKSSKHHEKRLLMRDFSPTAPIQAPEISMRQASKTMVLPEGPPSIAPSMRMLRESGFFGESFFDAIRLPQTTQPQSLLPLTEHEGSLLESYPENIASPQPLQRQEVQVEEVCPQAEIDDALLEFRVPVENIALETSQLMPETPPRNIQERFQRLKLAQQQPAVSSAYLEQYAASPTTPTVAYSPIKLESPSGGVCITPKRQSPAAQAEMIVDIHGTPIRPVRQFRDLEDMPFDELEYEDEPAFADISIEKPPSPPPRPSDIIKRITSRLTTIVQRSPVFSPAVLDLPQELPDEDLLELSLPSLVQSPIKTPPKKVKSPRVSLPMAWGEERPATPITPVAPVCHIEQTPTPIKVATPTKVPTPVVEQETIPEGPIVIPPPPKDPKDFKAMIMRARAIYKLAKQKEAEQAAKTPQPAKSKPKGRVPISRWQGPPPRAARTKPRMKLVLKKRAKESPKKEIVTAPSIQMLKEDEDQEEIECPSEPPALPQDYREAVARARLLRGLKNRTAALNPKVAAQIEAYNALPEVEKIKIRVAKMRKKPQRRRRIKPTLEQVAYLEALKQMGEYQPSPPQPAVCPTLSPSPRADSRQMSAAESRALADLAEFEALEQLDAAEASLAEFEALEAIEAPTTHEAAQSKAALNMSQIIADLRQQQLVTPPADPRERYKQLMSQRKAPQTPVYSPVKTPEIHYTPIVMTPSPSKGQQRQRAYSEVDEELMDDLGEIQEPSFLDITPCTPVERPRPQDIIEQIRTQVKKTFRPEVPTGHLVELRTPPRMLPLPADVDEEEFLGMISPRLETSLPRSPSPVCTPTRSPVRTPDISLPHLFQVTPPPPTPPLPPVSPLRHRIPSPEGPLVIPAHPKDPKDYKTMVRRARKIQELIALQEAEAKAAEEAALAAEAEKAAKAKKTRVPISRWVAPPPKKPGKRKKLVMRKRSEVLPKTQTKTGQIVECPTSPPPLPENFAKEVAMARKLAGLKSKSAAISPRVVAKAEASRNENEARMMAALAAPPSSPLKDYTGVLSRMRELKEKGVSMHGRPSLAASAYLNALKGAMQVLQDQQPTTESPKTRYQRILAERTMQAPTFEESQMVSPVHEDVCYSPIGLVSPRVGDAQIDLAEPITQQEIEVAAFKSLEGLEQLSELEEPSLIDVSQARIPSDQCFPITPPLTPPPAPSAIIDRIRQQYQQSIRSASPIISTPTAIQFPSELPEEELLDYSAPSFAQTPVKAQTTIMSPNISIPLYFEEEPIPVKEKTPVATPVSSRRPVTPAVAAAAEILPGVCPGLKVKSPETLVIPPPPKDPKDVAAMIRRAQIIQKVLAKQAAEKAASQKESKGRAPLSRKIPGRGRKLVLKKKEPKSEAPIPARECPAEPPELPAEYLAAVLRARKIAGIKPKEAQQPSTSTVAQVQQAASNYEAIMERVAALRATKQQFQQPLTSRELSHRQHLINRQQRQQRKRQLMDLELLRQQGLAPQPFKTPPPPQERLAAIKSRIAQTPMTTALPYSPVKTPEIADLPRYQPITLPPTPPYQFLENVSIPDIADVSMHFEDLDNYTLEYQDANEEADDLEFQLAEIATEAYQIGKNIDMEPERAEGFFNIAEKIQTLQQQLLESSNREEENVLEAFNLAKKLENLKNQLLQSPPQGEAQTDSVNKHFVCADMPELDEEEEPDRIDFDDFMDDFEAMERECL